MLFIILIFSFILIIKSSDMLIDGAAELAYYLRISPLVIGLTVVAFGTSAPEAAINIIASLHDKSDITLGNIIGSNITNIGIVIGIAGLIFTVKSDWSAIRIDIPYAFMSSTIFGLLVLDGLSKSDGLILGILLFLYLNYLWLLSKSSCKKMEDNKKKEIKIHRIFINLLIGIVGVVLGGRLVLNSSVEIAKILGFSEAFIGLTVVSFGTSLPELATCLVACYKKEDSIAVGNIIGSNIFNILFILSISSIITPITFNSKFMIDLVVMIILTLFLFVFCYTQKKVSRIEGFILTSLYIIYISYIYLRR
ncbi:calcium/sodium antiporter [Anaerosacchariphilus polymeriproducens]|uniref:Sodium:calcium antiporter n=1 Tax=Anaerosacchariphilus polymeriproducens TaxID=1812858 RepID=A0A371AX11_9FIRM|nr:calcium/sodium antiporter [Anaerosacchariphilus polymeriproducens]RDU24010.1 sodium:calcium antiporter [Anaerosacchariphilus polymeriproducens]